MSTSEPVARPEGEQVRIRVSVLPVTYVMTMSAAQWDGLAEEDRAAIVYDDAEVKCKFRTAYEVLHSEESS
jgi:TRAP-type C4-dicarboxylate transport system substrate-binding protein